MSTGCSGLGGSSRRQTRLERMPCSGRANAAGLLQDCCATCWLARICAGGSHAQSRRGVAKARSKVPQTIPAMCRRPESKLHLRNPHGRNRHRPFSVLQWPACVHCNCTLTKQTLLFLPETLLLGGLGSAQLASSTKGCMRVCSNSVIAIFVFDLLVQRRSCDRSYIVLYSTLQSPFLRFLSLVRSFFIDEIECGLRVTVHKPELLHSKVPVSRASRLALLLVHCIQTS